MVGPFDGTTVRLVQLQLPKDVVARTWKRQTHCGSTRLGM